MTAPPPPQGGGDRPDKRGEIARRGGGVRVMSATASLCGTIVAWDSATPRLREISRVRSGERASPVCQGLDPPQTSRALGQGLRPFGSPEGTSHSVLPARPRPSAWQGVPSPLQGGKVLSLVAWPRSASTRKGTQIGTAAAGRLPPPLALTRACPNTETPCFRTFGPGTRTWPVFAQGGRGYLFSSIETLKC